MLLQGAYNVIVESNHTTLMISFPTRQHHIAELYDACKLIVDTYRESDVFNVYSNEGLEDHINFAATAREVMSLIAEGDIK